MEDNPAYQEERPAEEHAGQTVMMAPASVNHNRVVTNISRILGNHLRGGHAKFSRTASRHV